MTIYQEEESSTFTHNGKLYSLNKLFEQTYTLKPTILDLSKVEWILKDSYVDPVRLEKADIEIPILVIHDQTLKLWVVLDGTHRVAKATKLKLKNIPAIIVTEEMLKQALIIQYYHLSFNNKLEGNWYPKIPDGSDIGEKTSLSEPNTLRISFSETLEGCFRAIYPNVSQYFEEKKYPWMEFYVYSPVITDKTKIVTSGRLTKERFVHDAHVTKEIWILNTVKVELISKIKVLNTSEEGDLFYYPFHDKHFDKRYHSPKEIKIEIMKRYKNEELPLYNKW